MPKSAPPKKHRKNKRTAKNGAVADKTAADMSVSASVQNNITQKLSDDVTAHTHAQSSSASADKAVQPAGSKHHVSNDLFQRAVAAHQAGQIEEAIGLYGAALRQNPNQADVWNNLGVALRRTKRFDAALQAYRRSADLRADNAGLWSNMGNCLREMMLFDEALTAHNKALSLDDSLKSHIFNTGLTYRDQNRFGEALEYFERALAIDPDYVDANWDRALAHLALGNYAQGWAGYETRRRLADNPIHPLDGVPEWDGKADLSGKRILLRGEQGFGDMIQFARFIPLVAKQAAHVIVECRKELATVMRTVDGVGSVVEKGQPLPSFDFHVPLLSLPHVLGIGAKELQKQSVNSYMRAPGGKRVRLSPAPGTVLKVGLIWAGKLTPRDRSCRLDLLLPIISAKGAAFYSFQIDERRGDIAKLGVGAFLTDLGDHIRDFGDSAVLMSAMDMVITIDSAPAHLAGAMGIPVWMLQLYTTDWRWMVDRADSPWYPSMRIYRQEKPGDWTSPIEKLSADFSTLLTARRQNQ
ncbi:tetratricopeptide repeat protein [Thalassospira sp. MA62]|nr:tetratricopeptide repeat protein [Thalassospira sp. MA62]